MPDGRRPDGNPDYTQYDYLPGDVVTAISLLPETKFEISYDSIMAETDIKVGGYLVPEDGGRKLLYVDMLEETNSKTCLVVEALKEFRLGGLFGAEFTKTVVARVKKCSVVGQNGLRLRSEIVDGLEIPLEAQTTVATLLTNGGEEPYIYSLVNGGQDNSLFEIDGNEIKTKEQIDEARIYHIAVKVTDKKGDSRNAIINVLIDNPSIKAISLTMTDDIRQGEASTQPGGLIAVAEVQGGTAPYVLSVEGQNANRFVVDLMSIKTGATPLNEGEYKTTLIATDSKGKTFSYNMTINVQQPYPEIESVTLNMEDSLTAPVLANTTVGHIQVLGGTPPYKITLPANIRDNDLFIIEDAIKAKANIDNPGSKTISVLVTDSHNKTKTALGTLNILPSDITAVNFSQTEGLREGESNVSTNAIIGTLSTTGGTKPITYSLTGGKDKDLFKISGNTVRVNNTALTTGEYKITVGASDGYDKSGSGDFTINVAEAYLPISNVSVKPVTGLVVPVASNTKVADITSENGKPPIVYSLPAGISNNDSFQISGNTVLTKGEISASGSYAVMVRGTDAKGNIKNSITTAFNIAAE